MEEWDALIFTQMVNQQDIQNNILKYWPISLSAEKTWIESTSQSSKKANLTICLQETDRVIGGIGRHNYHEINRTLETGTMIGFEKDRWQWYGTEAKMILLDYIFNTLNIRKVYSGFIAYNKASEKYSTSIGYVQEAILKEKHFKKGKYRDEHILSITKEQRQPHREKYKKKYFS